MQAADQRIAELRREPGVLGFEARVGGRSVPISIRTATEVIPPADPALACCLMPAMRQGGVLELEGAVSPLLLRGQREYQALQSAWSRRWTFGEEPLCEVEVRAALREPATRPPSGRVAAFFSGGVDSWATLLANPEVTDLIFVRGLDLDPAAPHQRDLAAEVEERLQGVAWARGLRLHVVDTDVRLLSDPLVRWEVFCSNPLVAIALFFESLFDRVLIASDSDYETQLPYGANRLADLLWSTEAVRIFDDGGRFTRTERIRLLASDPLARETLRVCWENRGGAYNCGECHKCLMTMVALEVVGSRRDFPTFPALELERVEALSLSKPIQLLIWEDIADAARAAGRGDLEPLLERVLATGRRALDAPPSYRVRGTETLGLPERLRGAERRVEEAERERDEARRRLELLVGSRSWRLTAPLRRLRRAAG